MRTSDGSSDVCASDLARRPSSLHQGGGQERGLRPGTLPVAACVGFGKACEIALERHSDDHAHAVSLQRAALAVLSALEGWHVNSTLDQRVPHNLSLTFAGVEADALLAMLPGFALATGSACRSEEHTSELQSLMRISYAVFCLKTK